MKIDVYIIAWNEEKILPFTLDYYSSFCDRIFVYDNMSNDSSIEIYRKYPKVEVIQWNSNNEINENNYINIKSYAYREKSRDADWVIVCDCDEFLYHESLLNKLTEYKNKGITVPLISGHDMVSDEFPIYDGDLITNKIKIGSDIYAPMCKNIIFDPKLDVNYGIGAHSFSAQGAIYSEDRELKLLHYKFLGKDYVKRIYISRAKRLSEFNKKHKFGEHYLNLPFEYMNKLLELNNKII